MITCRRRVLRIMVEITMLVALLLVPGASASVFYKFDIIGMTGQAGLTGMGDNPSINDNGTVAFVGQLAGGEGIFIGDGSAAPQNINPGFSNNPSRLFGRAVQINNRSQVVAHDSVSGAPPRTFVRIWDANAIDSFTTIARGGGATDPYDTIYSNPSINNINQVVFGALNNTVDVLVTGITPNFNETPLGIPMRPMIADNGRIIVRAGSKSTDPIRLYEYDLKNSVDIANTSMGFTQLGGSPGISDDGSIVVFAANTTDGTGIFASIDEGGSRKIVLIAGKNQGPNFRPELGFNETGSPLYFSSFDIDSRVAVSHIPLGDPGIIDDSFVVSFIATPNNASRDDPDIIPGPVPLIFSDKRGIWTVRVDADRNLSGPGVEYHTISPIPVVQIGDVIQGRTITDLKVNDQIANAAMDDNGTIRTQRRGDHRIAFWASTDKGGMVVRASHLDSSQDGLLDHWKSKGIDIDGDGVVDLDLSAMGAKIGKRDLFLEIDWLNDRNDILPGGTLLSPRHSNAPAPGVTQFLVDMFANASKLNGSKYGFRIDGKPPEDIPGGITVHVDAGAGNDLDGNPYSINMGTGPLQGGDMIGQLGDPTKHIDVVYFGLPGSINRGSPILGVETRSFHEIKDAYFGSALTDKWAREFAFHYAIFADFHSFLPNNTAPFIGNATGGTSDTLITAPNTFIGELADLNGDAVKITGGTGAGQIRRITANTPDQLKVSPDWIIIPDTTSTFTLLDGSSGLGEVTYRDDNSSIPGNDLILALQNFGITSFSELGTKNIVTGTEETIITSLNFFGFLPNNTSPFIRNATGGTNSTLMTAPNTFVMELANLSGNFTMIINGTGAGQIRRIMANTPNQLTVSPNWTIIPDTTSTFVLFNGTTDIKTIASQNLTVTLGNFVFNFSQGSYLNDPFNQQRSLAHELGHNLGLRHCGTMPDENICENKPDVYLSLMSYAHQLNESSTVHSYSNATDPTFDDWGNLTMDSQNAAIHLGNTFDLDLGAKFKPNMPEPTVADYERLNNASVDLEIPMASVDSPTPGTPISLGNALTVVVTATDNVKVNPVKVSFDIDGDGTVNGPGETVLATNTGPNTFEATFSNISGPTGTRMIRALASDPSYNTGIATSTIMVSQAAALGTPAITGFAPPSPVNDTVGTERAFNITVNQTVNVTWYINGTPVQTNMSVTNTIYTNTSAALGIWNVTATANNTNGIVSQEWIWNVTAAPAGAPSIVSFTPPSPVSDIVGATRAFNVTINQTANVTWYINGTQVQLNESVADAMYTNTSASEGTWIVNATATNANGSISKEWIWIVTAPPLPAIIGFAPSTPANDTVPATRTFNITVNQTVNVTWYFDSTVNKIDNLTTESNITVTTSLVGIHNVTAVAQNANGTDMQKWDWNVTAPQIVEAPAIISWGNDKTNDASLNIKVNVSETIHFNATANQSINTWNWFLNNTNQNNNFDNFSNHFAIPGTYEIKVNATNTNGTSNTIIWNINVQVPVVVPTFNISGFKINNSTKSGISGWNFTLMNSSMQTSTMTGADGSYKFMNLVNGTYNVTEETKPRFTNLTPTTVQVTINGSDVMNVNFTNQPTANSSISGMKFNDLDGNGIRNVGEPGLANWTIMLTKPDGTTMSTITDSNGNYIFTNLTAGNYTVGEVLQLGWIQTAPATGTYIVTITSGANITGLDFGNFHKGKITGGGWISITGDPKATFGIVGQYPDSSNTAQGSVEYQDHGPANLNVKSINITTVATTRDKKKGTITGYATVNGAGSYPFVVYVEDNGEPGKGVDVFRISLPTYPYSNGAILSGGNIQIHS